MTHTNISSLPGGSQGALPRVAVIIPAFNSQDSIKLLLESLRSVDYPGDRLDVFVVDNGSSDQTVSVAKSFGVHVLEEREIRGSYAARNLGVRHTSHDILAFTDSDCIASPSWIRAAVEVLASGQADIVGGRVEYFYPRGGTAAEYYDVLAHVQNRDLVERRRLCTTANLVTTSSVFEAVGPFAIGAQSGGDYAWTSRALEKGYRLVYSAEAVIRHPARDFEALMKKATFVGTGHWKQKRARKWSLRRIITVPVRSVVPMRFSTIRSLIRERGNETMLEKVPSIWAVAMLYQYRWASSALLSVAQGMIRGKHE